MADRIFAGVLLLLALGYTIIAFVAIKAPFQYDPVGPEGWPRLLGVTALVCAGYLVLHPTVASLEVTRSTAGRLALVVVLLLAYAAAFEPLGFIVSTWLFCAVLAAILGASPARAFAFGAASGVLGYLVFTFLLGLNLPSGLLKPWL